MDKKACLMFFAFIPWMALRALTQLFELVTGRLISYWNRNLEKNLYSLTFYRDCQFGCGHMPSMFAFSKHW